MSTALAYLRLCRPDAPVIALVSYLVGVILGGRDFTAYHAGVALLLAAVSTNFIYSFNSVMDWREDAVSHPARPIPAGKIPRRNALAYSLVLLAASVAYPFALALSPPTLAPFLLLPALGLAYSAPPVRLRRFPALAVVVISTGLVTPITLGYLTASTTLDLLPEIIALFIFLHQRRSAQSHRGRGRGRGGRTSQPLH